jgi:hypothetical protein
MLLVLTQQFPVSINNGPPPKGHPTNLTTVGNIGINMGQHPSETLLKHCSPCSDKLRLFWGQKGVQLNIRKMFLMFCTFSVYVMAIFDSSIVPFEYNLVVETEHLL